MASIKHRLAALPHAAHLCQGTSSISSDDNIHIVQGFVSKETIRAQYDGSLFYKLADREEQRRHTRAKERELRRSQKTA